MFKVSKFYQGMVKNTHSIRSFMESSRKNLGNVWRAEEKYVSLQLKM